MKLGLGYRLNKGSIIPFKNKYHLKFDGTDERVACGSAVALQNLTAKSVVLWFKSTGFTGIAQYLYDSGYWIANYGTRISISASANNVSVTLRKVGDIQSYTIPFTPDQWNSVAYTWDGTTIKYYLNGVYQEGHDDAFSGALACTSNLFFGSRNNGSQYFYVGGIDEIAIFNRALSQIEITKLFGGGTPQTCGNTKKISGLVGFWRCGDDAIFPTIPDVSGNGNNGAMINMEAEDIRAY